MLNSGFFNKTTLTIVFTITPKRRLNAGMYSLFFAIKIAFWVCIRDSKTTIGQEILISCIAVCFSYKENDLNKILTAVGAKK
jgi:hypothetical protein